tara:strand:- start:613 stop:966 length:354 start_codon:yes stop_codon:yes gene_type:complete
MMTIKEAKAYRCKPETEWMKGTTMDNDRHCEMFHNTCRRCELHTGLWSFNRKAGLCDLCNKEYKEWYSKEITIPAVKAFDAEREAGGDPEGSPFMLMQAYSEWMKEAPIKNRRIIDI